MCRSIYDLVAIGNPVYDIIITPYISTKDRVLSGCSTNACLAARKLGMKKVALIGYIGRDFLGKFLDDLKKYRIEAPNVKISEESGGFKLIYNTLGDRTLDVLGVAEKISPSDIPDECLRTRYFLVGPILQEVDLDVVLFLRETTNSKIFLDPQGLIRKIRQNGRIAYECREETLRKIVGLCDFVKPNEHESTVMTKNTDPFVSARILVEWGSPVGIVTLAEKGSVIYDGEKFLKIPAYETFAKDPTGAGDVYAGAFLFMYDKTRDIASSGLFASAAASIMVENSGPDFVMNEKEVRRRLTKLENTCIK